MEWFYAKDGERLGPYSESTLEQRLASGEITGETLVWCRGMEDWVTLEAVRANFAERRGFGSLDITPPCRCFECGAAFSADELVVIGERKVCSGCKSAVLAALREGVPDKGSLVVRRNGRFVVMSRRALLPGRCFCCNLPVGLSPIKRRIPLVEAGWFPSAMVSVVLGTAFFMGGIPGGGLGFVSGVLLSSVLVSRFFGHRMGDSFSVIVWACARHRRSSLVRALSANGVVLAGILCASFHAGGPVSYLTGLILFLVGSVLADRIGRLVWIYRVHGSDLWLGGAGPEFLDSLPEQPCSLPRPF